MLLPPKVTHVGNIVSKHGYKGSLSINLNPSFEEEINTGDFLFVIIDQKGVPFLVESINPSKSIVKLKDIDTEELAQSLISLPIAIEWQPHHEQSQTSDFEGFQVFDQHQTFIGEIKAIEEYPGHPMLIVFGDNREILIPLIEDWILDLNADSRTLQLDLPIGLLNPEEHED